MGVASLPPVFLAGRQFCFVNANRPWGYKLGPQPNLASVGNAERWGRQNQTGFHFGECQNRIGFPLGNRG